MRGVPLEEFVEQLLAGPVAARSAEAVQPRTPEQIRAWLDFLVQFSNKIPPLPDGLPRVDLPGPRLDWRLTRVWSTPIFCGALHDVPIRTTNLLTPLLPNCRWRAPLFTTPTKILLSCGM